MQHGPVRKHAFRGAPFNMNSDFEVAVVLPDAGQRLADLLFRAFQPLHVDVGPADQGAGNGVPCIRAPCMHQNSAQGTHVIAKGP